ncbi:MAG: DCC1-like thiol-disulfide oxidoreductase family protein [Haloferacaceae archaeon]|jgi:predicted DCC family thiol-disulfide oxidoreductase YuxK
MAYDAVLIYDGDCPYCSVAAAALRRAEGVGAVPWTGDAAQSFLTAQFDREEAPFAMFLVDERRRRVYAGRAAAEELAERAGAPTLVGSLVRENYETIASVVGLASGRERDPADYHAIYPLDDAARERFGALRGAAVAEAPT